MAKASPLKLLVQNIIGASLSKPNINVLNTSSVYMYVCLYVFICRTVNTFILLNNNIHVGIM